MVNFRHVPRMKEARGTDEMKKIQDSRWIFSGFTHEATFFFSSSFYIFSMTRIIKE